jgi:uncharacterized integral membrane protein
MWIVKWVLTILFILVMLLFGFQNMEQTASVRFLNRVSPNLPLCLILYIAFAAGILTWVLVSIFNILKLKSRVHRLQRENKAVKEELNRLRNASIEEELETSERDEEEALERKALSRKKR